MTETALLQPASTLKRPNCGPSVSSRVRRHKIAKSTDDSTATETFLSGRENNFTVFNDPTKLPQLATTQAATYTPTIKPPETTASPANANVPAELGKLITRDVKLLRKLGWKKLVTGRRQRGDFADMRSMRHPAKHLLQHYQSNGVPVMFHNTPWSKEKLDAAMERGPHKSANEHVEFLCEDFLDMIDKSQWIILPYDEVKNMKGLRLSPPGVIPQRNRRPRWIGDYTWSEVNQDTVPLAPMDAMQYGKALDRIIREILVSNPKYGPVQLIKTDLSDGFYRVNLRIEDIPKLALIFPDIPGRQRLVALPLCLPMGWKLSPPHFCAVTETIADITNARLGTVPKEQPFHKLDKRANDVKVKQGGPVQLQVPRDPNLPCLANPQAKAEIFVDDFVLMAQGNEKRLRALRSTLFTVIDEVFRANDEKDTSTSRKETISLKKLDQGDCTRASLKSVLGWMIDTIKETLELPEHRIVRLQEILDQIPPSQKRTSAKKWHKVLGELRSMAAALPGARGLFSQMQLALRTDSKHRINLSKGVHAALDDFRFLHKDIANRPTKMQEIVPLDPVLSKYHDASGFACGGVVIPNNTAVSRHKDCNPILWRASFPKSIQKRLVSFKNPTGDITNSDLELVAGIVSNDAAAQNFDIQERTVHSNTDNTPTLFWMRKGSTTTNSAPAYLLRAQALHQRFHRYVHRIDFIKGEHNDISDIPSRKPHWSDEELLTYFNLHYPQSLPWKMWTPPPEMMSCMTSCLLRKTFPKESLLRQPIASSFTGAIGSNSAAAYPSTPFSRGAKTQSSSSKSMPGDIERVPYPISGKPYVRTPSIMPYGLLAKRASVWGPRTHASTNLE